MAGLEPFGGAKTGDLIASIDSPPGQKTMQFCSRKSGYLAFVHLNIIVSEVFVLQNMNQKVY